MRLPPGPRSALWTIRGYVRDPLYCLIPLTAKHGETFTMPGKTPLVCCGSPEGIETIYRADPTSMVPMSDDMATFLGQTSMILVGGERHRRLRKLMMPPFHGDRMRAYGELMCRLTAQRTRSWRVGQTVTMLEVMQRISLDVIMEAAFGVDDPATMAEIGDLLLATIEGISPLIAMFPALRRSFGGIGPFARFQARQRRLWRVLDDLIERARASEPTDSVLSLLVRARDEDGEPMGDEEIRHQLLLLVVAGHETTAIALCWALYALHRPESTPVRERLQQELEALGNEPDPATLAKQPYLDAVCHETLRRFPLAPAPAPRRLLKPLDLLDFRLPEGVGVAAAIGAAHFREETYPDPLAFRPERFLERQFTPFEYLPFGGGARRCLGAAMASYELRLVLGTVLRGCRLRLASDAPDRGKVRAANVGPASGVPMVVEERR